MRKSNKTFGFTILEFVFTLFILAILAVFAAPLFSKFMVKERINADLYRIYTSIQSAQEIAALSSRPVIIMPNPDSGVTYPRGATQSQKRAYWGQESIITAYIPEDLYYSTHYDLSKYSDATKFLSDIRKRWAIKNDEDILRGEEYITFALPEEEQKNASQRWSSFRRFEVITIGDGAYRGTHPEFIGLDGRAIVIDPSGAIVSGLKFNFYHEGNQEEPALYATVGLCLPLYQNLELNNVSFKPEGNINNFIPYFRTYASGEASEDERFGFCTEKY